MRVVDKAFDDPGLNLRNAPRLMFFNLHFPGIGGSRAFEIRGKSRLVFGDLETPNGSRDAGDFLELYESCVCRRVGYWGKPTTTVLQPKPAVALHKKHPSETSFRRFNETSRATLQGRCARFFSKVPQATIVTCSLLSQSRYAAHPFEGFMSAPEAIARFGASVRSLRFGLGISQEELAERADMHRTYIAGIERGHAECDVKEHRQTGPGVRRLNCGPP